TVPYYTHFSPIRNLTLNLLEIGVGGWDGTSYNNPSRGGESLRFWKDYFCNSNIFAIDIQDKSCLQEERIAVFQGSQTDPDFLDSVIEQIGKIDIIIDDGSHVNLDVIFTFEKLF